MGHRSIIREAGAGEQAELFEAAPTAVCDGECCHPGKMCGERFIWFGSAWGPCDGGNSSVDSGN